MSDEFLSRERHGEAFWRTHHEAWRRSELNQREYCEAQGIPLKAFGNWRAKFKAEPLPRQVSVNIGSVSASATRHGWPFRAAAVLTGSDARSAARI